MVICYCDRCGKQLDLDKMTYVGTSMTDYGDDGPDRINWDFCRPCAAEIKEEIKASINKKKSNEKKKNQHPPVDLKWPGWDE